jgi:hypothetical protein
MPETARVSRTLLYPLKCFAMYLLKRLNPSFILRQLPPTYSLIIKIKINLIYNTLFSTLLILWE